MCTCTVRPFVAASIALGVLLAAGCSDGSSSTSSGTTRCLYRDVFAALEAVPRVRALCPTWLPDGVEPTYVNVSTIPEYVVELETPGLRRYRHVVLQLSLHEPPGNRLGEAEVDRYRGVIYFEPSPSSGAAGLHSGHYIIEVPGSAYQRGSYLVSVHQVSQRTRQWNIQRLLKIARSLRPVSR